MKDESMHAIPLNELSDYEVADNEPDVRGWDVIGAGGEKIGEVDQLLVDTAAMKVRYLDIEVDGKLLQGEKERHILVPVGYARLDRDDEQVRVDQLRATELSQIPEYKHEPLTRDYEITVRQRYEPGYQAGTGRDTDFYGHEIYDPGRFYL